MGIWGSWNSPLHPGCPGFKLPALDRFATVAAVKRKQQKARKAPSRKGTVGQAATIVPAPRRRFWFRVLAVLAVPLLVLLLAEAGLRLAGYGYSTAFFKPLEIDGRQMLVENDKFGWRFFPRSVARAPAPVVIPAVKEPGTFRIFVFGESAALGDPRPAYGFSRYLEVLLRERFPEGRFEVVNVAMTAISSHVIREIARECAALDGDLWIVYAGNNEYYGPFGAGTVFGASALPLPLVRAQLALQRTRFGQLLADVAGRLRGAAGSEAPDWTGLRMFVGHELAPSDPRRKVVQRNFAKNLEAIFRYGTRAGAEILMVDMAVNLRDCAPFASMDSPGLAATDLEEWRKLYRSGAVLQDSGEIIGALPILRVAAIENSDHAEATFRRAEAELVASNQVEAAVLFAEARNLDALPLRADGGLMVAAAEIKLGSMKDRLRWVRVDRALADKDELGLPGAEAFYEHVHLTFTGNYRLARTVADDVKELLPGGETFGKETGWSVEWASQAVCERRLGLTDWNRSTALEDMVVRLLDAPYTNQLHAAERVQRLWDELGRRRERMDPISELEASAAYKEALKRSPQDHRLYENQAEFRELTGDLAGAAQGWEQVQKLLPHHFSGWYHQGRLLRKVGQTEEARAALEKSLELRPDLAEARLELASLDVAAKQLESALAQCDVALRLRPNQARPHVLRADILARLDRREEALASLREAIRVQPSDWEAHYLLGVELAVEEKLPEAETCFAEAVRLNPGHVLSHVNLGVALAKQARFADAAAQFQEALRLDPVNQSALQALAMIRSLDRGTGSGPSSQP